MPADDPSRGREPPPHTPPPGAAPGLPPGRGPLSRRLFRIGGRRGEVEAQSIGAVVEGLGERSFGWTILIFALLSLLPMPPGATVFLAVPLLIVTGQMALGLRQVWLPGIVARRQVDRRAFQRLVLWLRPLIRPVERLVRPRMQAIFAPGPERAIGGFLFCVAAALSLPIPISVYLPALALFVSGIGLVERDGLVTLAGLGLGLAAIVVTAALAFAIVSGALALAG